MHNFQHNDKIVLKIVENHSYKALSAVKNLFVDKLLILTTIYICYIVRGMKSFTFY